MMKFEKHPHYLSMTHMRRLQHLQSASVLPVSIQLLELPKALFEDKPIFAIHDRPRKRHTRMAVSALRSISNRADDGKLACCTR
jgi:hypothetical protein